LPKFLAIFNKIGVVENDDDIDLRQAKNNNLEVWANAQRDGRPVEYRWRPLFNAAMFG